jgi:CubicO group peptidase (beta-lactamase class C family)
MTTDGEWSGVDPAPDPTTAMRMARPDWVVAPGYEAVAAEFQRNFTERGDRGAAFAAFRGEETLIDIWGGLAETGRPWAADTLQPIFSGSKGLVAICVLIQIDRGLIDLEAPVRRYWPEFAASGKAEVTVRQLVTHSASLPGLAESVQLSDLTDRELITRNLERQPPFADPRAAHAYNPLTFGWLCGELVRRTDGRPVGRFLAEEVAAPLGLEVYVGLPQELEPRVARMELVEGFGKRHRHRPDGEDRLIWAVWANPPVWAPETFPWNRADYHRAEIPAAGGIGAARSMAKLYALLDRLLSPAALTLASTVLERRLDPLIDETQTFGVGFELGDERGLFGPVRGGFGHTGAGGSTHGRWPDQQIGFSYAMNQMRHQDDERATKLLKALSTCLPD